MPKPLVSIVVLNYNYARFLPRSIGSALGQDYLNHEVIVVDDASTDESAEVISGFEGAVTAVLQTENQGQGAAMNAGFKAAKGEVVFFLDADDHLYPHAVSKVISVWAPWVAMVQFRLNLVDPNGEIFDLYPASEVTFDSGNVVQLLLNTGRFETAVTSGLAFSRRTLEGILPIPENEFRMSADGYLVTVAPLVGPVISLDSPLGAYWQHGSNSWAGIRASPEKFRRLLAHDEGRYRALREKALDLGLQVAPSLGNGDYRHLANRVASLTLDPPGHPTSSDSPLNLAWRGVKATRRAKLPLARRALLAGWFAATGVLPKVFAKPLVAWYLDKMSRPQVIQKVLHAVRVITQ